MNFEESIFSNVVFENCKTEGTAFNEGRVLDTSFKEVLGRMINFSGSKIKNTKFIDSNFKCSYFEDVEFYKTEFTNMNLEDVNFCGSKLKGIDFRTSVIDGIKIKIEDVRGMIVDSFQATEISKILGLIIK